MIIFVVYQTKIVDNKLTFDFWESFDSYDDAKELAESQPNCIICPFDDDDEYDNPETYFQDKED